MEQQLERERPPAYTSHDPDTLHLPSVPQHDPHLSLQLPDIKSLGLPSSTQFLANGAQHTSQWQSPPAQHVFHTPVRSEFPIRTSEGASPAASVMSHESSNKPQSVATTDDAETRMAAEALSALGKLEFGRSPPSRPSARPSEQPQWQRTNSSKSQSPNEKPEPLLQLLTASHPWVGNTINGSLTAYETTKYYSPAFVRSSAEFVERNIGSPLSNTVGSISRRTGVEAGVRRYLGQRRPSDQEVRADTKRRRVKDPSPEPKDVEMGLQSPPPSATIASPHVFNYRSRAGSQASFDSLPAYDDNRSPKYEESAVLQTKERPHSQQQYSNDWRSQLLITTSGLGAALSESSLRSLKFCLSVLRHASTHVATIANALKSLLDDASAAPPAHDAAAANRPSTRRHLTPEAAHSSALLAARIKALAAAILQTVQAVVSAVNSHTGAALPANAAALVRRQILSIPHRMRAAESAAADADAGAEGEGEDADPLRAGRKWLDFATQSLDMIEQVTLVVGGTISSAERWLESMGRKREEGAAEAEKDGEAMSGVVNGDGAVDGIPEKR